MQLISFFLSYSKFHRAPEGSHQKLNAQKHLLEVMEHRLHIDTSIQLIGKLLFGSEQGPEVLETVRPAGQPLVDDWSCLKSMVSRPIVLPFRHIELRCVSESSYELLFCFAMWSCC